MMRIAVAGGGGLGYLLATSIAQADNAYNVVVLSRTPRPEYITFDIQVHTVDYMNQESLSYALRGIDLVISTVSGAEQMNLIQAAGEGSVRHFVPAEFEGKLSATRRASADDPLRPNSMSTQTFNLLRHYEQRRRMKHTVFSCGILMETFHPDGLGHFNMGAGVGLQNPGDFLLNINTAAATYTHRNTSNRRVHVCLTSAYDLAQFIVAALEIGPANWPSEYTLRGDRLSVEELVNICSRLRNVQFDHHRYTIPELAAFVDWTTQAGEVEQAAYYQRLLATANGRYDFSTASLNDRLAAIHHEFAPMNFEQWLARILYPTPPE